MPADDITSQPPAEPRATLLVVDDEAAVRRVLVMRLQLAGYRVICAEDGEEALTLFHQEQPDLVVPSQSPVAAKAADFALFLTNAANQLRFAQEARVLPSSLAALEQLQAELQRDQGQLGSEKLVQRARLLSAQTLERSRVLVPAMPGVKRLQAIVYTQLQRAMLGQRSSEQAITEAAHEWNRYAAARWPEAR